MKYQQFKEWYNGRGSPIEMKETKLHQKTIIPLFNVKLEEPVHLHIDRNQCVERLIFNMFPEPIRIIPGKPIEKQTYGQPIKIPFPPPEINIHFYPWRRQENMANEMKDVILRDQLPPDFDTFDNVGKVAVRPGTSGTGGFQTVTTLHTMRIATALLIVEFDQIYPRDIASSITMPTNPYGINLIDSLLDAVRLISGNEPHQYKGYHFTNNRIVDTLTKWPLAEFQGPEVNLNAYDLNEIKKLLLNIWRIRSESSKSKSRRILILALEYYYLSSTMTQTRTIFLYLMIAFEALFKAQDEKSASAASSRLAKLLANNKSDYNHIHSFMWDPKKNDGCCQIRNHVVHGDFTPIPTAVFWRLRDLLRYAIISIVNLILSSQIDPQDYYVSLDSYANNRFSELSNK